MLALSNTRNYVASISVSVSYSQSNLIIPELDTDPAILKVIHDGEKLKRETCRKELMAILKIQPPALPTMDSSASYTAHSSPNYESVQTTPGSRTYPEQTSQIWIKRTVPVTPNSSSQQRLQYRSAAHQRSLNSSGSSAMDSPKSSNNSFMKQTRSDTNISSSPASSNRISPMRSNGNPTNLTPSGTIVTDYRQSTAMKRIVNPQWNIIPFA